MGRGSRKRKIGRGTDRSRAVTSATLFVVLGLVAAFAVSAVAGLWDDEPTGTGLRAMDVSVDDPSSIRVEVLNGAGTSGLARSVTHELRADGFDVVFYGNAGRFDHARSFVLARTGDRPSAQAVAAALGVDSVGTAVDSSLLLDVTVVLGDDWPPATPEAEGWRTRIRELMGGDSVPEPTP